MKTVKGVTNGLLGVAAAIAVAAAAFGSPPAVAASALLERAKSEGMRVGFFNYRPFAYVDDKGEIVGESVGVLSAVLGKMGIDNVETVSTEWGALIPGLNAGRFDVVASGMFITPKRCKAVQFSNPTFGIKQTLIVPKGNPKGITDYESIRDMGLRLAVITGAAHEKYALDIGIPQSSILQYPDLATSFAALRAGRADAYGSHNVGAKSNLVGDPAEYLEAVPPFAEIGGKRTVSYGAFAFRKSDAGFVAEFNQAMADFIGSEQHLAMIEPFNFSTDELPDADEAALCGM